MNAAKTTTLVCLCLFSLVLPARSQDNVTIPKSRLQELEEKERELNRLKGDLTKTKDENALLKKQQEEPAAKAAVAAEPIVHPSPPIVSLPPLKETDEVDAIDLVNYYRTDPAAADARYLRQKFMLRGEIVGFEKPWVKRDYKVLLKTPDRDTRVICNFFPPEEFNAVFTAVHGSQLVALKGETRVPLAKVGENVVMHAECKGWKDSCVIISAGAMRPVAPVAKKD